MLEPTNQSRAWLAQITLQSYMSATKTPPSAQDTETTIGDLLADLQHYCDRESIDFDTCIRMATMHHEEEAEEGAP